MERSPEAATGIRPKLKILIVRKLDVINSGNERRLFQPDAMLHALQIEYGMPPVRAFSQLSFAEITKVQTDVRMRARGRRGRLYRDDRRQDLRRPEDRLVEKGARGISREKPTPNVVECELTVGESDSRAGKQDCGAGIPKRGRLRRRLRRAHSIHPTTSS